MGGKLVFCVLKLLYFFSYAVENVRKQLWASQIQKIQQEIF